MQNFPIVLGVLGSDANPSLALIAINSIFLLVVLGSITRSQNFDDFEAKNLFAASMSNFNLWTRVRSVHVIRPKL